MHLIKYHWYKCSLHRPIRYAFRYCDDFSNN